MKHREIQKYKQKEKYKSINQRNTKIEVNDRRDTDVIRSMIDGSTDII